MEVTNSKRVIDFQVEKSGLERTPILSKVGRARRPHRAVPSWRCGRALGTPRPTTPSPIGELSRGSLKIVGKIQEIDFIRPDKVIRSRGTIVSPDSHVRLGRSPHRLI